MIPDDDPLPSQRGRTADRNKHDPKLLFYKCWRPPSLSALFSAQSHQVWQAFYQVATTFICHFPTLETFCSNYCWWNVFWQVLRTWERSTLRKGRQVAGARSPIDSAHSPVLSQVSSTGSFHLTPLRGSLLLSFAMLIRTTVRCLLLVDRYRSDCLVFKILVVASTVAAIIGVMGVMSFMMMSLVWEVDLSKELAFLAAVIPVWLASSDVVALVAVVLLALVFVFVALLSLLDFSVSFRYFRVLFRNPSDSSRESILWMSISSTWQSNH